MHSHIKNSFLRVLISQLKERIIFYFQRNIDFCSSRQEMCTSVPILFLLLPLSYFEMLQNWFQNDVLLKTLKLPKAKIIKKFLGHYLTKSKILSPIHVHWTSFWNDSFVHQKKRKILKISKMGNIKGLFLITKFFF